MPVPAIYRQALEAWAAWLRERFGDRVRLVRLFGSWARGTAHADSDIDVAAVIDGLTWEEWGEAVGAVAAVERETDVTLSPIVLSGERFDTLLERERRLPRDILEEGVPL